MSGYTDIISLESEWEKMSGSPQEVMHSYKNQINQIFESIVRIRCVYAKTILPI